MDEVAEPSAEDIFAGWLDDLERLKHEVLVLHLDRYLWRELNKAIDAEPPTSGSWTQHYARLYWQTQVMGLRRVCVSRRGSISLTSLLGDIADHPEVMTLQRHLDMYEGDEDFDYLRREAAKAFEAMWGDGAGGVDLAKFQKRAAELRSDLKAVLHWADKVLAHLDRQGTTLGLTFDEVSEATDTVGSVWKDLALLLTAGGWGTLTPVIQDDWQEPFRRPLFKPFPKPWSEQNGGDGE